GPLLGRGDLHGWLAPVVAVEPALAVEVAVADVAVPATVGAAFAGAVAEALRNAARHAGVDRVRLRAWSSGGVVRVELADDGRGFDPAQVPAHRRGVRESVVARMSEVGGRATVASRPGNGTPILLQWPAAPAAPPGPRSTDATDATAGADRPGNEPDDDDSPAQATRPGRPTGSGHNAEPDDDGPGDDDDPAPAARPPP